MDGERKLVHLPEAFTLPTPLDLDGAVAQADEAMTEAGGPSSLLGTVRFERKSWASMEFNVIRPLAVQAFRYEDVRSGGYPPNTNLAMSKAALSGMLFGHMINERVYPNLLSAKAYSTNNPINVALTSKIADYEALWENDQQQAYRLGMQAMAALFTDTLSVASNDRVGRWGAVMVGDERTDHFRFGFGAALYLAWDAYSDMLIAKGDSESVQHYINNNMPTN